MREIDYGAYSLQISEDFLSSYESYPFCSDPEIITISPEKRKELLPKVFTRRRLFRELLEVWPTATGLEDYAILEAHGNQVNNQWVYMESGRVLGTVQSWIDSLDGKFAALMIRSCNPQNSEVSSQRSLVFHLNREERAWMLDMALHPEVIRLYVPGEGYLEKDYKRLRRIINRLKTT